MSIYKNLKSEGLSTNIGSFKLSEGNNVLGEGGNSFVYSFYKEHIDGERKEFAIKFLKIDSTLDKKNRFIDEYFCAVQLDNHPNVVRLYHFDIVKIDNEEYYIIIMKKYSESLKKRVVKLSDDDLENEFIKVRTDLFQAMQFLHTNNVIHRDIKPENIFYDDTNKSYVLGDLGIAFFDPEKFTRVTQTKEGERLGNYLFSAPEQREVGRGDIGEFSDIYAFGQVLYWLKHGKTYQGVDHVSDKLINRCLLSEQGKRFQNCSEISKFFEEANQKKYDPWKPIRALDEIIRRNFTTIENVNSTSDPQKIRKFLVMLSEYDSLSDFWWSDSNGGDLELSGLAHIQDNIWLFSNYHEIEVKQLIVYRDPYHSTYNNFIVLVLKPTSPFDIVDNKGEKIIRNTSQYRQDEAVLWQGKYLAEKEIRNGFYDTGEEIVDVNSEFHIRYRFLESFAYVIAPRGTWLNYVRTDIPKRFLKTVIEQGDCDINLVNGFIRDLKKYGRLDNKIDMML